MTDLSELDDLFNAFEEEYESQLEQICNWSLMGFMAFRGRMPSPDEAHTMFTEATGSILGIRTQVVKQRMIRFVEESNEEKRRLEEAIEEELAGELDYDEDYEDGDDGDYDA